MQNWVVYGIIAAVCFAVNTIIYKIAFQKGNFSPYYGSFMFGIGVVLVFFIFLLAKPSFDFELKSSGLAILAGMVWGTGFVFVAIAIAKNADVSRLASIYNTNTLLAVLLGIFVLKELPNAAQAIKIVIGAIFIVVGAILVSV